MATKVLAVDDEKIIIKGLKFSLERDGFEVICAYDADEALAFAESEIRTSFYLMLCFRDLAVMKYVKE